MTQRSIQTGASQRGPAQLDTAKRNRGIHVADVTIDAPDQQPLASGGTVGSERRRALDPQHTYESPFPPRETLAPPGSLSAQQTAKLDDDEDLDDEDPDDDLDEDEVVRPAGKPALGG